MSYLKRIGFLKDLFYSSFAFKESVFYDFDLYELTITGRSFL